MLVKKLAGSFSNDEKDGYDRVLKGLYQRLNDEVLMEAFSLWRAKAMGEPVSDLSGLTGR